MVFIQNRTAEVAPSTSQKGVNNGDDDSNLEGSWIGLIAAAATLLVLVLLAALAVARRKRSKSLTGPTAKVAKVDEVLSLEGSLAEQDSLALQPQQLMIIPEDGHVRHPHPNDDKLGEPATENLVVVGRAEQPFDAGKSAGGVSTTDGVFVEDQQVGCPQRESR